MGFRFVDSGPAKGHVAREKLLNSILQPGRGDAAQVTEIGDILACGEPWIKPRVIEQGANIPLGVGRIVVNANAASLRFQYTTDHSQRRRLTGPVGPEKSGDGPIASCEGKVLHSNSFTELLMQLFDFDHRAASV